MIDPEVRRLYVKKKINCKARYENGAKTTTVSDATEQAQT
jgi:hypothetical protein